MQSTMYRLLVRTLRSHRSLLKKYPIVLRRISKHLLFPKRKISEPHYRRIKKTCCRGKKYFSKEKEKKEKGEISPLCADGYWCLPFRAVDNQVRVTVDILDGRNLHG